MAKIWLDIDDKVLALVQQHAREIGITVEGLIAEHLGGNGTAKMPTKVASSGRVPIGAIRSRNRTSLPLKGPCVLDFCCTSLGLCVEIDGDEHASKTARDAARTRFLNSRGIWVIRFTNRDVWGNLDGVREAIALELQRLQDLTPTRRAKPADLPLSGGGMEHA